LAVTDLYDLESGMGEEIGGSADCPPGPPRQVCALSCVPHLLFDIDWDFEEECRAGADL
jgi:hypothetical protein